MVKIDYKPGDKVLAKVKGYPPWPALIVENKGKKRYSVLFYGTKETGTIKIEDLYLYSQFKESYVPKYLKRAGYETAVREIEEVIKAELDTSEVQTEDDDYKTNATNKHSDSLVPVRTGKKKTFNKRGSASKRKRNSTAGTAMEESDEPSVKKGKGSLSTGSKVEIDTLIDKEDNGNIVEEPEESIKNNESAEETISNTQKQPEICSSPNTTEPDQVKVYDDAIDKSTDIQMKDTTTDIPDQSKVVLEYSLKNNILYAEHVRKNPEFYKQKPVEYRDSSPDDIVPLILSNGKVYGVKLHNEWPLNYTNEYDRALYDEETAKKVLQIQNAILKDGKVPSDQLIHTSLTSEHIQEIFYARDVENKKVRLERLKRESQFLNWDSQIKSHLGLDKASPELALNNLKNFSTFEKDLDALTFKKHSHVVDTIRRLQKYVGNTEEWTMNQNEYEIFAKKSEQIRTEAEKIYNKMQNIIEESEREDQKGPFWDIFMKSVATFRTNCQDLTENEILSLCSEPGTRSAFLEKLDSITD
ncbi:hypothetical protein ABEB36_002562 [Hypothenemus hampei]|uniref:PWWP domain-containing protein n=1 Tax=Hypothenemus hampei TaxID=57062 RepID=A0ABD1F695_HYPHA